MELKVNEALTLLDSILREKLKTDKGLSDIQELVFCQCWMGQSYYQIAQEHGYEAEYIKKVGYQLWRSLSEALNQKVTKKNLHSVLRQYQQTQSNNLFSPISMASEPIQGEGFQDWGTAMNVTWFWGRNGELEKLEQWILRDHCNLIAIVGFGGIGKTALSIKLAQQVQQEFDCLIWRSLHDVPPLTEILEDLLKCLCKNQSPSLPNTLKGRISLLLTSLKQQRSLIILDNFETLLRTENLDQSGIQLKADYLKLLTQIGEIEHKSCVILTSREKPEAIANLEGAILPVRTLQLRGIGAIAAQKLLHAKGLSISEQEINRLSQCYHGNPLALKIAATSIQDIFAGNIDTFWQQEVTVFQEIRLLIEQQLCHLSSLEKDIMYWLAIVRSPVTISQLIWDLCPSPTKSELMMALERLCRRSLIEKVVSSASDKPIIQFTQQPAIMEHIIDDFIGKIVQEILSEKVNLLSKHCLIQADSQDFIRQAQIRLILAPIAHQLLTQLGEQKTVENKLRQLLAQFRQTPHSSIGYAGGSIINLLWQIGCHFNDWDFSHLTIRQAYLAHVSLHGVNFAHSNLERSIFAETFGGIIAVAFSPKGDYLATGDTSGNIHIWDIKRGIQQLAFKGHQLWVWSLAFSPDGEKLASGGYDNLIKIWEVKTGRILKQLEGHTLSLSEVIFSPDGEKLASCSQDGTIRLWNAQIEASNECLLILKDHVYRVWSVAFSPDGTKLVSGAEDNTVKIWDLERGNCLQTLEGHTYWVTSVAFSPDGEWIASGSFDQTIKVWEISTGRCFQTFVGHDDKILAIVFTPDGQRLASCSYDRTVRLWDIKLGKCVNILQGHSNRIWTLTISQDGSHLASGGDDHAAKLWDVATGKCLKTFQGHTNSPLSLHLSKDGQSLASGYQDQTIRLWDWQTGQLLSTMRGHKDRVWSVAFSPQLSKKTFPLLASGSADYTIKLWNSQTGEALDTLNGHKSWVWSVAFSSDGNWLVSSSYDRSVKLWKIKNGECYQTFNGHQGPVARAIFSPDGQQIVSSSFDETIRLWDVHSGDCFKILQGHTNNVWSVVFSPDGQYLASCSYDKSLKLWSRKTGECLQTYQGHSDSVFAIAFDPFGHTLASGGYDRTLRIWDVKTGKCLHTIESHEDVILNVLFVPQAPNIIMSCSFDQTIRVWDILSGQCVRVLQPIRPYEKMNLTGVTGLTEAQKSTLFQLGAVFHKSLFASSNRVP